MKRSTRVFYKFNAPEIELEFVKRTRNFLIVKYPTGSVLFGKTWKIGRQLEKDFTKAGVLRIEE